MATLSKVCRTCKQTKTVEMFTKAKGNKDGYSNQCRACKAIYDAEKRKLDPERNKMRCRAYAYREKLAAKERVKQWRIDNPEKYKAQQKAISVRLGKEGRRKRYNDWWMTKIVLQDNWRAKVSAKYKTMHPDWEKQFIKVAKKHERKELSDRYIKSLLTKQTKLEIPQELIEIKRLQLLIRRTTNGKRNTTTR